MIDKGTISDIPLLVNSIWISEHTGNELYTYPSLFDLSEESFKEKFSAILRTEVHGHSLTYKDFWIYKEDNKPAGALSCFKEGSNGDSAHIMTGLLMEHFSRADVMKAFQRLAQFKSIQFAKTKDVYQIDSVSVFPEYRGRGIFGKMLKSIFHQINSEKQVPTEIQVWQGNTSAINAYSKEGFSIKETKLFENTNHGRLLLTNF